MTERQYLAALSTFYYFGPVRVKLLISYFGNAKNAWMANRQLLTEINLSPRTISAFLNYKKRFDDEAYFNDLEKRKIRFVAINESDYPINLKEIENAPPILYYIGNLKKDDSNSIAIVGARKMSSYGNEVAYKFSYELAKLGFPIVSGLALGIDAVAHKACLDAGGRGIVVLASGLDTISPLTNKWIAERIVKEGGVIMSEYPLGQPAYKTSFPARNRIISGLSKAVVVIEGMRKSGTLLTASAAADQGRPVFAIPGQIYSPLSGAPHFLIQNGAKLITSVKDILDELNLYSVNTNEVKH